MKYPSSLPRPHWLDNRLLLILVVTFFLLAAGAYSSQPSRAALASAPNSGAESAVLPQLEETPSPESTPIQPSRTPYPPNCSPTAARPLASAWSPRCSSSSWRAESSASSSATANQSSYFENITLKHHNHRTRVSPPPYPGSQIFSITQFFAG